MIILVLFYSTIILAIIILILYFSHSRLQIDGILLDKPRNITDINLVNHHGKPFTKNDLKNHWTFLFFGFTHCEMICPTTLVMLDKVIILLNADLPIDQIPQVIFITIDPEHDTIEKLNRYITSYNRNFIAVRTKPSDTKALENQFSVTVRKQKETLDHSTQIILLNPNAQIQAYFPYPQKPERIARDYKLIIQKMTKP